MDLVSKGRARCTLARIFREKCDRRAETGKCAVSHIIVMSLRSKWARILTALFLVGTSAASAEESADWVKSLTSDKGPGAFALPHPMRLAYRFGWHGIPAAAADVRVTSPAKNTLQIDAKGGTSGLSRILFKLDVYHQATENASTLRPIHFFQEEKYRSETVKTSVDFGPTQVTGIREKIPSTQLPKPNTFRFSPVFDMATALLWVRSQPLQDGDTESIVVWASNAPYLATVKVIGRDVVRIAGRDQRAIKLELHIKRIDKTMQLKEHKLFKSGRGWISDDDKRIPLRIEADIFIGYVFAELESVVEE
jgi:Protein of unknown function (DUF3108)